MSGYARIKSRELPPSDRSWDIRALCRDDEDPERFFRDETSSVEFCRRCPVVSECLRWALATDQATGVWGGKTEQERRALKRANTTSSPVGVWPLCPKGLHEMSPEHTQNNGECRPCRNIYDANYRAKPGVIRYPCPTCGRHIAATHGGTHLSSHKNYGNNGAYCPPHRIPEVQQ